MHNWSGFVRFTPRQVVKPGSLEELQRIVGESAQSGRSIRVIGSGHSFTPLIETDDILLSLDNWQGIEEIDLSKHTVKVRGGTKLRRLGKELLAYGLRQENLGDIDVQSISGAVSTGTHGTGIDFGVVSTQVESLTLITADGGLLECSAEQNAEVFKAAQVSLGVLGVIAYVTLRVVPMQRLHMHGRRERLGECFDNLERYKRENTYFSFLWAPYTDWVQLKFLNETTEPVSKQSALKNFINKVVIKNGVYWIISEMCRLFPPVSKHFSKLAGSSNTIIDEVDYSHRIFSTPRMVRFQEMEYNIPAEHLPTVLREIQQCIERYRFDVHFPMECRFVREDDIWLSPAYGRASAYIAVPMYRGMKYEAYFQHMEAIFRRYEGRPHWAKEHSQDAQSLAQLYPHWHDFQRIRTKLDPQGVFLNKYLRDLFDAKVAVESEAFA